MPNSEPSLLEWRGLAMDSPPWRPDTLNFHFANYDYDHLGRVVLKDKRAGMVKQDYSIHGFQVWINYDKDKRVRYEDGKLYNSDGSEYSGKINGFLKQSVNALNTISTSKTGREMLSALSSSKNIFDIKSASQSAKRKNEFYAFDNKKAYAEGIKGNPDMLKRYEKQGADLSGGSGGTIYWDVHGAQLPTTQGMKYNSETDLAHEMAHGYDADRGLLNKTEEVDGVAREEYQASYRENLIRQELNRPLRTYFNSTTDGDGNFIEGRGPLLNSQSQPILPAGYKP